MHVLPLRAGLPALARIAVGAIVILSLAGPSVATAAPNGPTMVVALRAFPGGDAIPDQVAGTFPLQPGAPVTIVAPLQTFGPGTPQPTYGFIFWNTGSDVRTTPTLSFTAPTDTSTIKVTAWYLAQGGSCKDWCPPSSGVSTYAFSLNSDQVVANTPIASVTPNGAWAGPPSTTVSTTTSTGPVGITAQRLMSGSGLFHSWLQFGNGTVSNAVLNVPYNGASMAIAFFGIPVPDPCQDVRNDLDNLSPGDFLTLQAYQRARAQLVHELQACEHQYGEI